MTDVNAYGGGNEIDIIVQDCYTTSIPDGVFCVALAGDPQDELALSLSSNLISGNTYTLSFSAYSEISFVPQGDLEIGLSNSNSSFGTLIYTANTIVDTWVSYSFVFTAPLTGGYITARNVAGVHWNRVDNFSFCQNQIELDLGNDTIICGGTNLVLNIPISDATFQWQDNSTDSIYNVTENGVYWADVNANGCTTRDSIVVDFGESPEPNLGSNTNICNGENLSLDVSLLNATYLWQDNSTNQTFTVYDAGIYWVQATNTCGTTTDSITISSIETPNIDLGEDVLICAGASIQLNAETIGATNYLWQNGSMDNVLNASNEGTYWVEVSFGNCKSTDSVDVSFYTTQQINLGADTTLCEGEAINLSVSIENAIYNWSDLSTESTNTITTAGIYWIDVTIDNCTIRDSIEINFTPLPNLTLIADTALCENDVFILDATTEDATYLWQNNSNAASYQVDQQGTYWVKITVNYCTITDSIFINYNPFPVFNLGKDKSFCEGESAELKIEVPNATYLWQDNSTTSAYTTSQAGIYYATATLNNCNFSDTVEVDFENEFCNCQLFIPNSFTPNQDGLNDLFKATSNCPLSEFFLTIYNRWGEIVYTSDDITSGWNGAIADYYAPNGVYYWTVKSKIANGDFSEQKSGTVTILR
jgi:gliding motility-associated-like protein